MEIGIDNYTDDPIIKELLTRLFAAGEHLSEELKRELLEADTALDDALNAILADPETAYVRGPGQGWAPLHAATIIAVRRANKPVRKAS